MLAKSLLPVSRLRADQNPNRGASSTVRVALILGKDFPSDIADLFCSKVYQPGVSITRISGDDSRLVNPLNYHEMGSGFRALPVRTLTTKDAISFDMIEHINFFSDEEGGTVSRYWWDSDYTDEMIRWGFT